jgi:hypothetical protein
MVKIISKQIASFMMNETSYTHFCTFLVNLNQFIFFLNQGNPPFLSNSVNTKYKFDECFDFEPYEYTLDFQVSE